MLDRKGIFSFLAITFGITYSIEIALILAGFRIIPGQSSYKQLIIAAVMWAPGLATVVTARWITREGLSLANLRLGPWKPYLANALLIPAIFVMIYALTWLLGLAQPDWQLVQFQDIFRQAGMQMPPMPSPLLVLALIFLASLFPAPLLNGLIAFGEELGWRGYLLPKLMPLGKTKAYLLTGIVWGLWHLPLVLVGFTYPGYPLLGALAFTFLLTGLGIYLNELTLRYRSSFLAGWVHGIFNSQKLGLWALLFPTLNPLLGGFAGLIGILAWFALGMWQVRRGDAAAASLQMKPAQGPAAL